MSRSNRLDKLHETYDDQGLDAVIAEVFEDAYLLGQQTANPDRRAWTSYADLQAYLTVPQDG